MSSVSIPVPTPDFFTVAKTYQDAKSISDQMEIGVRYRAAKKQLKMAYWCYLDRDKLTVQDFADMCPGERADKEAAAAKTAKKCAEWKKKGFPYFSIEDATINRLTLRYHVFNFADAWQSSRNCQEIVQTRQAKSEFKKIVKEAIEEGDSSYALKKQLKNLNARTTLKIDQWYKKYPRFVRPMQCAIL